ncbi:uncharacterized protein [Choristoneura fumiferana]|uniref:uncharacterized protein n=1 Tax=Choristoneura fumiferana TaxID=7141 RepID=UPI003D15C940
MCYVHTKSNPADIATRPELFEEKIKLWFSGPEFLQKNEHSWPENRCYETHTTFLSVGEGQGGSPGNPEINDEEMEDVRLEKPMQCEYTGEHTEFTDTDIHPENDNIAKATTEIKKLQAQHFPDELSGKKTHLSRNLDLFLDVDGLLRCRGRMSNTTWSYDMKYPILLPKNCEFTNEIIKETHERNYHVGASHTLNFIRQKYWIPQGKPQVIKVIQKCPQCIKHGGDRIDYRPHQHYHQRG